ncbi:trypsin alpha-like [Musca vetustissima]|uniref:trypsin alpha-like n=1 Tax=Musca vetustissima TaxID=27455 RepID=UPI002AB7CF11|nr:trypsin alpha-like [Musca vetustissima]
MLKIAIVLVTLSSTLAANIPGGLLPQLNGRIVGGVATDISSYPWQISLQRSGYHSCGGSIYSKNIVITSAHCMQDVTISVLKVRAGSSQWNEGGILLNIASFKTHEGFSSWSMVNDVAVLRLSSSLIFSPTIRSIALATKSPLDNAAAVVTGWGARSFESGVLANTLQYVNVSIVSNVECRSPVYGYGWQIQPTMLCAYAKGKDAFQGDSGGPLVSGGQLVGVVSWGYGCALPNYPGVYADVAVLRPWIIRAASSI